MPYSAEHKKKSRLRILESAANRFLHQGFEGTSIDEIMLDAGLTRGTFYAHFDSKSELYAKAMTYAASYGRVVAAMKSEKEGMDWFQSVLQGYLSKDHLNDEHLPCPMAFLVTDVANREPEVRQTYTKIYRRLNRLMARYSSDGKHRDSDILLAVTAMMIGGVALGRTMDDTKLTERLLASCRKAAFRLLDDEI